MAETVNGRPRERLMVGENTRPALPRYVRLQYDDIRSRWVLLAPERIIAPDEIAVDILQLCDGRRTLGQIADQLAATYDAPVAEILSDITYLLQGLADSGYIKDTSENDAR
jgi:pyrroloquinoline quinone biosynthesis protein D